MFCKIRIGIEKRMKKKKILFSCAWKYNRKNSWSGTHFALYRHLNKEFDVFEFDTGIHSKIFFVKLAVIADKILSKVLPYNTLGWRGKFINYYAVKKYRNKDFVLFQFEEFPYITGVDNYIYQDLHMGYVKKMMEEMPELFKSSGYQKLQYKAVVAREKSQKDFYKHVTAVFTMGHWLRKELIEYYGLPEQKVFCVGGGYNVNPEFIHSEMKSGNKILFIGRDFYRKNGFLVIDAFKLLKKTKPEIELYIAGPENLKVSYPGIHILGNLKYSELVYYYNLCDVFCMPSKFEAYGLVFAEALAFGLPCIGRDAFEMPYFIDDGKTGFLLKSENPNELSELMKKALESDEMKRNVVDKRAFYLYEYSWNTVINRIAKVINAK